MSMRQMIFLVLIAQIFIACSSDTKRDSQLTTEEQNVMMQSGYADLNGLKMYYEIHGDGFPLVLIHGGGSTINTTFGRIIPLLSKSHRVIAVEMQAHGRTLDIDRPLSFESDADDIAALLNYLNIEKADVFGFSNGASTTLQFAIRHPELANKIVTGSTFYNRSGAPSWFWNFMSNPSFATMPQPYKDAYLAVNTDKDGLYRMYKRDVARMQSFPDISDDQMKGIISPALIIAGDKDVVTLEHLVKMSGLIHDSRLAIIPGGHGDYIGEITCEQHPELVAATSEMITRFLKEE